MRILLPTFTKRSKVIIQSLIFAGVLLILTWSCKKEDPPTLTTLTANEINGNTAQSGGNITDDGGASVSARGIVWSTSENPTMNNKEGSTSDGTGDGQFVSNLTGLSPGTTYYVRAYAVNITATAYGNQEQFTTVDLASVATADVTEITTRTTTSGGNVTDDGGAEVTARGVVWGTSEIPAVESYIGKTNDGSGTGSFISELTELNPGTTYYIRAYATNLEGTSYGEQIEFSTNAELATVNTTEVTELTSTSAISGGNITNDGGADITARGVVYNTNETPTVENNEGITTDGTGTGEFTSSLNGLTPNTTYYVRAYAANSEGTAYGEQLSFITLAESGGDETEVVEVTNPATGKTWMDRNLGASRAATSSTDEEAYGDLYQWGRGPDGHQKRTSGTTANLSSTDTPGHASFITAGSSTNYDWRSPQNDNLWQGVNGTNNPCPAGYRLPTGAEWNAERASWGSNNSAGAFASPLKLPVAGDRDYSNGSLTHVGSGGLYWSSTVYLTFSRYLAFSGSDALMLNYYRTYGFSVRCIKD